MNRLTHKHLHTILLILCALLAVQCTSPPSKEHTQEQHSFDASVERAPERIHEVIFTPDTCASKQLIDHAKWEKVSLENDPFAHLKKSGMYCAPNGTKIEDGVIEFDTNICRFHSVSQPLKHALPKGTQITLLYWHLDLYNESPAKGYVGLAFAQKIVYENEINIPHAADVYEVTLTIKNDLPKGTKTTFHIHNHGANTWKLLSFETKCSP